MSDIDQMGIGEADDAVALIAALLHEDTTHVEQLSRSVARSRAKIAELGSLSALLTGEPSMIDQTAAAEITCEECEATLPAYVDAWLAGEPLDTTYAALHRHLRMCPACAAMARELYQVMATAAAPTPAFLNFAEARHRMKATPTTSTLWLAGTDRVYRLIDQIMVVFEESKARFEPLAAGLSPQLVPATALRGTQADKLIEVLELPHPEQDLVIRLRMGALQHDLGALALQFATLEQGNTLGDIKVTLRDADGSLLESTRSDSDGLALFDALEAGKYQLQIEQADQMWLLGVTIQS